MKSEKVRFENGDGITLTGRLEMPSATPQAYALFAHCFTCTKNIKAAANITRALADCGIAVLRFDFTGLGESEGDFADTNFSSQVSDLVAAAGHLAAEYEAPQLLVGHSLGGTACLMAAPQIPSSRAVATIGSPATASHIGRLLAGKREDIERDGRAEVSLGGRPFTINKQFIDDIENQDVASTIHNLRRALMVLHSPVDEVVGIDNAAEIFTSALHPKSFISLDKADHLLSDETDSRYVGTVLATWARKYLELDTPSVLEPAQTGGTVTRIGSGGFYTEVNSAGHRLIADEPESYGGTDLGPSPYDLLATALGACTSMTLRMYADRKKLQVPSITVDVVHEKIHAKDCATCETEEGKVDSFKRTIRIGGDIDAEVAQRMLEIADRCPVHRTLHSEVEILTELT